MPLQYFPNELRTLGKLKTQGFSPAVIFDIGASTGIWSESMLEVCPAARYHLFEPLAQYAESYIADLTVRLRLRKNMTLHPIALGEENGTAEMLMFRDAHGSSLLDAGYEPVVERRLQVPVFRLDDYIKQQSLRQPQVIKIDCQGSEATILRGGEQAARNAQVLFLETWLKRSYGPKTPLLTELIEMLESWGFWLMDFGEQFHDEQKRLYSVDAVFYSDQLLRQIEFYTAPTSDADRLFLSAKLLRMIGKSEYLRDVQPPRANSVDLIVTHAEINQRHGVGVLLSRLFARASDVRSVRSREMFGGETSLSGRETLLAHDAEKSDAIYGNVLRALGEYGVGRVLCVPYYADDVKTAVAAKEIYNVPMCTFLMDDQNIFARGIEDSLMRQLLEKSALRLAISPELRDAYHEKYKLPIWYMPPVVPDSLIPAKLIPVPTGPEAGNPVMIGNVWGEQWLGRLRLTVRNSGIQLTWCSNAGFDGLSCSREDLKDDSVFGMDPLPDRELVDLLRNRAFAIVPSGTLEADDDRSFIARLSLPSRLVFMMATAHIPVIVLGHPDTAVAKFVTRLGLGLVSPYVQKPFLEAVRAISDPRTNLMMRERAHAIASKFSDKGATEWIWRSLERGEPVDRRFEDLLALESAAIAS